MRRILLLLHIIASTILLANDHATTYINTYKNLAVEEMNKYGIPASIKLAQGMLESDLGRSDLATVANNHFGIKCGGKWRGDTYYKHDDDRDRRGNLIKSCFRSFDDVRDSYRAHSEFLRDPNKQERYGWLFLLNRSDYRGWARGLKQSGYATDPNYPQKLIKIIEQYDLQQYDSSTEPLYSYSERNKSTRKRSNIETKERESILEAEEAIVGQYIKVNNCRAYIVSHEGTFEDVVLRLGHDVKTVLDINDAYTYPDAVVTEGDLIYIDKKKRSFLGEEGYHKVGEGETLVSIAQMYGIRIKSLRAKNMFPKGAEVVVGETMSLKKTLRGKERPKFKKADMKRKHKFLKI